MLTEPLQVRQFAIVDHEPVDRGPNAGIFTGRGPADDRAELYLLAEGTTPAGESFAGHVVSAAGQSWQTLDLSMTGALGKIVKDADESLRAWNRKSIAQHRVSLGLTALARRGDQVILAQAGPSVAFHRRAGRTDVYYTDEEHGGPVGTGPVASPQLTRLDLAAGDCLLLVSTAALGQMDERLVSDMLGLPAAQLLANIYRRVGALRHVTAILIAAGDGPGALLAAPEEPGADFIIGAEALPEPALPEGDPFQPSLFIQGRAGYDVESARRSLTDVSARARATAAALPPSRMEIPAPLQLAVGDDVRGRLNATVRSRASLAGIAGPLSVPRLGSGRVAGHGTTTDDGSARHDRRGRSFTRSLVRGEPAPPAPRISAGEVPLAAELADEIRARPRALTAVAETIATENAVSLAPGETLVQPRAAMRGRWHGSGVLRSRRSIGVLPPTWMIVLVGLGALLLAVSVIALPRMLQSSDEDRLQSLIANAEEALATSRAVTDPAEKRVALVSAQGLLLEARDLSRGGADVTRLLLEVNDSLAVLDAVRTPLSVVELGSLEQFGKKPVAPTRIAVSATFAYLIDSASSQVIAVALESGDHTVVYGEDAGTNRGRPLAIAVYDAGGSEPSLLVLDVAGDLWSVPQAGPALPLTLMGVGHATDIVVVGRDLLVLDAGAATVSRLTPTEGGFQNPVKILEAPELAQAQRIAIDGEEIFTSSKNGTLHRYAGKFALTLAQGGIDRPLTALATPWPLPNGGGLAILDAPTDRIVVLRLDGTFDHQYRHANFASASALALADGRAYLFAGGKLWRADLSD